MTQPPVQSSVADTNPVVSQGGMGANLSSSSSLSSTNSTTQAKQRKYADNIKQVFWKNAGLQQPPNLPLASSASHVSISADSAISTADKLNILEKVLDELEGSRLVNQDLSYQTTASDGSGFRPIQDDAVQTLAAGMVGLPQESPSQSSRVSMARKEAEGATAPAIEQAASLQVVEQEKSPELSPEVEKYLQEVQQDKDQAPKEIVIADDTANLPSDNQFVSEPVLVLPITPEIEKKGKRRSPLFSIRWLVEWSQKIIKMFAGKVIYLQAPSDD